MEIINTGQYTPSALISKSVSGFGIENSIQRLRFIFGENATFNIKNLNNNEVITTLKIPKT
jgi:hypothetical protein